MSGHTMSDGVRQSRLILVFSLVAFFAMGLAAGTARSDEQTPPAAISPEEYVTQADDAFSKGDIVAAMELLRTAAEAGYVPAQVQYAYHLDYAEEDVEAFRWYHSAAEAGDPEAQLKLGKLYASGEGTDKDLQQAVDWLVRSADQGHPAAIRILAMTYEQGGEIADISYESAVKWLEAGAAHDDLWSTSRLSDAYRRGDLGLRIDRERAERLSEKAEQLRTISAQQEAQRALEREKDAQDEG